MPLPVKILSCSDWTPLFPQLIQSPILFKIKEAAKRHTHGCFVPRFKAT